MGQRTAFSPGDVAKLNAMYKCNKNTPAEVAPPMSGFPAAAASAVASIIATASQQPNQHKPNRPLLNLVGSWFGKDEENEIETGGEHKPIASLTIT